jgi:hypothetical protein
MGPRLAEASVIQAVQRAMPRGETAWRRSLLLAVATAAVACAKTAPAPPQTYSGFLEDYSMLEPGEGDDAALVWVAPDADLGRYDKLWIDVTVWYGVGTGLHDIPAEDLQTLANHLYSAMVAELQQDYPLVRKPGERVLRVQIALTEAQGSDVVPNTISALMPIRPLSRLTKVATGTSAFVGSAGIEAKIVDSRSERLLAAVVDRREGTKSLDGIDDTWSDVLAAFEFWARGLREALAELRAESAHP